MTKPRQPTAIHDHGTDIAAAFAHAHTLSTGGWAIRTRRIDGRWKVYVYQYGNTAQ